MFVRQVKRKCSVRGCKSTDCFAISQTREMGNSVIICKSCLEKALKAIGEIDPATKSNIPRVENAPAPALFFNAKALAAAEAMAEVGEDEESSAPGDTGHDEAKQQADGDDTADADDEAEHTSGEDEPEQSEQSESPTDEGEIDTHNDADAESGVVSCPDCGKEFDSEKGLKAHLRYCKQPTAEEVEA